MATIVRGTVPAEELALHHTLNELPDAEIECERIVRGGDSVIMPLLWIRYSDRDEISAVLEADPTVDSVTCLSSFKTEYLYKMEWVDKVHLLFHMITNGAATILDAYGRKDCWQVRVFYPNREHFSRTHEFAAEHGLSFDVASIREMEGEPAGRYGLTQGQYRALLLAAKLGYFEVPREVTLEELADEIDVSHQSLSEMIRRGCCALIEDTLSIGAIEDEKQSS